jgi:hypothetical protein
LLRSKAADSSTMNEEQRNEVGMVVRHPPSHERDRTHPDNGSMNTLVSTPPGSLRVRKLLHISCTSLFYAELHARCHCLIFLLLMTSLPDSR